MTQSVTDFSEYSLSVQPSDWTARWDTGNVTYTVETGGADKVLRANCGTGDRKILTWNDIDSDADRANTELLIKVRVAAMAPAAPSFGVVVRGSGTNTTETGYVCMYNNPYLQLTRYNSGTATTIATVAKTLTANTWYWMRFRVNGTALQARYWQDGGSEPGTWDIDTTNSSITGAGWVGIFAFDPVSDPEYEVFAVGTNGDAAVLGGAPIELAGDAAAQASASAVLATTAAALQAAAVAQASASATLGGIAIFNPADRGTVDVAASYVTPNGSTPTIFIRNRYITEQIAAGARFCFAQVSGVNGLQPVFDVDLSNMELYYAPTFKFKWSYTGEIGTWQDFTTSSKQTSPSVYRSQHGSAFTQDTVYISWNYPWRIAYTLPWIQSLESSGYIDYAPSGGSSYQFETRSATTNGVTSGTGDVIPAQPLYSFKISSGAGNAPDGNPKRKLVMVSGTHASEDNGNYCLKGAVEFLCSSDAAAVSVRQWFDAFVYPVISSAGRAGGGSRNDFEDLSKGADTNRSFDGSPVLETVTKHKSAINTDTGGSAQVFIDFHGAYAWANYYESYFEAASASDAACVKWNTAIDSITPVDVMASQSSEYTTGWAKASLGAAFNITPEPGDAFNYSLATVEAFGALQIKAIAYLIAQGEWGQVALAGSALVVASASGALTTDIPLSGAAVATSSASGSMEAQVSLSGAALAQAVSSALLSTGIVMTADAVAQAAADGTLDTAIQLLGGAQAQAGGSGSLTTSTGGLEGNAQASASASASLSAQIRLSGAAIASAGASGSLGGSANLAGTAVSTASASGELTVNIALTAQALASAIAQGSLTAQILLDADAAAQAQAGAELSGGSALVVPDTLQIITAPAGRPRRAGFLYGHRHGIKIGA